MNDDKLTTELLWDLRKNRLDLTNSGRDSGLRELEGGALVELNCKLKGER